MEDFELFPDEEEEAEQEEGGTNRLFIFLVAGFGVVLLLGICAFGAWAFLIYPSMQSNAAQNQVVYETETAVAAVATEIPTEPGQEVPTETAEPIDAGQPTATQKPTAATKTLPTPSATPAEVAGGATAEPTATLQPTPTRRPTVTPRPESTAVSTAMDAAVDTPESSTPGDTDVPETGLGAFGIGAVAVGLLLALFVVRRLRQPV